LGSALVGAEPLVADAAAGRFRQARSPMVTPAVTSTANTTPTKTIPRFLRMATFDGRPPHRTRRAGAGKEKLSRQRYGNGHKSPPTSLPSPDGSWGGQAPYLSAMALPSIVLMPARGNTAIRT
jgi:hypothetical protein